MDKEVSAFRVSRYGFNISMCKQNDQKKNQKKLTKKRNESTIFINRNGQSLHCPCCSFLPKSWDAGVDFAVVTSLYLYLLYLQLFVCNCCMYKPGAPAPQSSGQFDLPALETHMGNSNRGNESNAAAPMELLCFIQWLKVVRGVTAREKSLWGYIVDCSVK